MIRFLPLEEVEAIHRVLMNRSGGLTGVRDQGALLSAIAQPTMSFGGEELYPTLVDKAAALGFSLVRNHPFLDGNKRVGHLAMVTFLDLNGWRIVADVDEQEGIILRLAAGELKRDEFVAWVESHCQPRT